MLAQADAEAKKQMEEKLAKEKEALEAELNRQKDELDNQRAAFEEE